MTSNMRLNPLKIKPSTYLPAGRLATEADIHCRSYFSDFHSYFVNAGLDDYNLRRLEAAAFSLVPILISSGKDFSQSTALEVGCGRGLKAFPVARLFKRYIGVDLEEEAIFSAQIAAKALELHGLTFVCDNATSVIEHPQDFGIDGKVDVLFLHAVMEHLTDLERLSVFELMDQVRKTGGSIVLLETPNRLVSFDHHSSQLHFVDHLPDSLAYEYIRRKTNNSFAKEFVSEGFFEKSQGRSEMMARSVLLRENDPATRLYRLGRGMSYHDFELSYYDNPISFVPQADSYHPLLLNHQPVTRDEIRLENYFRDNKMDVHRLFSRAWIDMIDFNDGTKPCGNRASLILPRLVAGRLEKRKEFWNLDSYCLEAHGEIVFLLPDASSTLTLILEMVAPGSRIGISVDGDQIAEILLDELAEQRPPTWHQQYYVPIDLLDLPAGGKEVIVRNLSGVQVVSHGAISDG